MRYHTSNYKNDIKEPGRQLQTIISYGDKTIDDANIFNANINTNSDLLKTVMKQVDFNSKIRIEKKTIFNLKNGLLINENYEYINLGDYKVEEVNYDIETNSFTHECYDFMINTMINYENSNISFPITLRDYINAIANKCGLEFANKNDEFVNFNVVINKDNFQGYTYTFRDVLDYICQLIGGWIIINSDNKLAIKYPTETGETFNGDYLKNKNISFGKKYGPINSVIFSRGNDADTISRNDETSIFKNGLCAIKIKDNPFLEGDDRENFIQALFEKINGLEFYLIDIVSTGIIFLEIGDLYTFRPDEKVIQVLKSGITKSGLRKSQSFSENRYKCLLLNDEINITSGLSENIYCGEPNISVLDYKSADTTDSGLKNAIIQTNKNSAELLLKVNNNNVISSINLSPEKIKIGTNKLDVNGILQVLGQSGSTTINGDNITTGNLKSENYIPNVSGMNISLDEGTIDTKNFKTDNLGNIYLGEGGKIIGGDGIMSTMIVTGNVWSNNFLGGNGFMPLGFDEVDGVGVATSNMLEFIIPSTFTPKKAFIYLRHIPLISKISLDGMQPVDITGNVRNLKAYLCNDNSFYRQISFVGTPPTISGNYVEMQNVLGENGFTGNSAGMTETTADISNYIKNPGTYSIQLKSDYSATNSEAVYRATGCIIAQLYIFGYEKEEIQ